MRLIDAVQLLDTIEYIVAEVWKNGRNMNFLSVPSWYNILQFGAVNCAQQSCDRFSIQGTPTLRLFYGGYGTKGIDVPANMDVEQLRIQLLQQLEIAQSYGFVKSQNLPNFLLMS